MRLALSTDSNYVFQTGVTIYSAIKNNSEIKEIYVLGSGLKKEDENFFRKMEKRFGKKIIVVSVEENEKCRVMCSDHLTCATFNRLMLDRLLPESIDRIMYLDSDILVIGDITGFYNNRHLSSHSAVVVEGYTSKSREYIKNTASERKWENAVKCGVTAKRRVGIQKNDKYFNAGVMLMNLSKMRKNSVGQRCLDAQKEIRYFDADQGVLNYVLKGDVVYAPTKYNCRPDVYARKWQRYLRQNAAIFHYSRKPWKKWNVSGGSMWWKYAFELDTCRSIDYFIKRGSRV